VYKLLIPFSGLFHWFLATFLVLSLIGCVPSRPQPKPPAEVLAAYEVKKMNDNLKRTAKRLRRKRISSSRNRYEGSLWQYESSFGNLLRDHRARFRGDLLSINEMSLIVNVPPPKTPAEGQPAGGAETANVALEALTLRDSIEEEQNRDYMLLQCTSNYPADPADANLKAMQTMAMAFGLPVVVLVDGKSASAAEIVAAALQDRNRAVVIGTASFGKGSVQTVLRLPNDGEITLTWSHLVAPSGYIFHGLGIRPSICTSGFQGSAQTVIDQAMNNRTKIEDMFIAWRKPGLPDKGKRTQLRNSCPARLNRRCVISGRSKGYYRRFGISRIALRELALRGQLPGMRKASL